ncbi:hypothetical protein [Micromonospora sp. NPDC023814]|uniref:hypothetical protein n=1 Tax=Micromonospora sp. NPDC023814 TaxID=3154596 RepID=UPI0033EEC100
MRVPRSRLGQWLRACLAATAVAAVALPLAGSAVPASPGRPGGVGADDRRVLGLAEQLLTRECMRRAGFELWVVPPVPADQLRAFPYVVDDVAWARAHGFGTDLVAATDERRRADPNQRYFAALPAERRVAALAALNGARPEGLEARVPSGGVVRRSADGCTSEAQRQLYGDLPAWYRSSKVVADLSYLRQRRVLAEPPADRDGDLADPAWTAALRPWSRCVRQQGYPVDTPDPLREAVVTRGRRPRWPRR